MKALVTMTAQETDATPSQTEYQTTSETFVFRLHGRVNADDFLPWMQAHARKLGVSFTVTDAASHCISIRANGAEDLVDAFALACSLGPKSVFVETLTFVDRPAEQACDEKIGKSGNMTAQS